MVPTGATARPWSVGRTAAALTAGACVSGLLLWTQPHADGSEPIQAPAPIARPADGEPDARGRTPRGRLRVRVFGDLLGKPATITVRGVRGQARGKKMRVRLTTAARKHLPAGTYTITASKIRTEGFLSEVRRAKRKIRLAGGRSRTVAFRYVLQDSGSSDAGGQDMLTRDVDVRARQGNIAASPDGSRMYVATGVPNISVLNAADGTSVNQIPTNSSPGGIALSPDGARLYFTESLVGKAALVTVDTTTGQRLGSPVTVGNGCSAATSCTGQIAVSPDGSRVYVPLRTGRSVAVVDPAAGVVERAVSVQSNPQTVAVSPDGSRLFTANSGPGTLSVLDSTSGRELHSVRVGPGAFGVAVSRDGHYAYVSSSGRLTGVDTASGTVAFAVRTGGVGRSVALSPDGARAYVAVENDDTVAVVDVQRRRSDDPVPGAAGPFGLAFTPDGMALYVTQTRSNSVGIIETRIRIPEVESVSVTGNAVPGQTLRAVVGTVVSVPAPATLSYRWQRSSSRNGPFTNIPAATSQHYSVAPADAGQYVRVAVTPVNLLERGPVRASAALFVAKGPPPGPGPSPTPTTAPPTATTSPTPPGPTPPTPTASPTPAAVAVKALVRPRADRSKLFVKVSPSLDRSHHWRFSVQKKKKQTWRTQGKKYRTAGARQTRTINLPRGTYRVLVAPAYGYAGTTSKPVRLKR